MGSKDHLEILKRGVDTWNWWREENPNVKPDLSRLQARGKADLCGVNLIEAILKEADLRKTNLHGADLRRASITRADLSGVDLGGAKLGGAKLGGTNLHGANLRRANLSEAIISGGDLSGTNLSETMLLGAIFNDLDLSGTDLSHAMIGWTQFSDVDLSSAEGLDTVEHEGPSTIGIDTIYRSNGNIPESFLRGAGVPDTLIAQIPALIGALQPIEFYSCFISYSHKNEDFAKRLHSRMRDEHLRVWFAPEDMRAGRKVHEQIEEAIRYYDKLLLVLSEDSMNSQWVETEIYHARQREIKEKRRVLFPIRLVDFETIRDWTCFDADTGRDMAREIREYYIPDFSNWKDHDAFEKAFDRLLRDLKAEDRQML